MEAYPGDGVSEHDIGGEEQRRLCIESKNGTQKRSDSRPCYERGWGVDEKARSRESR